MADNLIGLAQAHHASDDASCILLRWSAEAEAPNVAA
jgi:serine/threonine protein phosphatase PrpC